MEKIVNRECTKCYLERRWCEQPAEWNGEVVIPAKTYPGKPPAKVAIIRRVASRMVDGTPNMVTVKWLNGMVEQVPYLWFRKPDAVEALAALDIEEEP
jgi:hypothetical protein